MRKACLLSVSLFLLSFVPAVDQLAAKKPTAPIVLFNGRNLDNFYTYLKTNHHQDPKGVFRVADGQIRISGEEWGAITTKESHFATTT